MPLAVIQKKLSEYATLIPCYFGWFLNEASSKELSDIAFEALQKTSEFIPYFKNNLKSIQSKQKLLVVFVY